MGGVVSSRSKASLRFNSIGSFPLKQKCYRCSKVFDSVCHYTYIREKQGDPSVMFLCRLCLNYFERSNKDASGDVITFIKKGKLSTSNKAVYITRKLRDFEMAGRLDSYIQNKVYKQS